MAAAGALRPPWAPPLVLLHTTISQHAVQQVYVIKTKEYYCCYYLLALQRHDALLTCHAAVCLLPVAADDGTLCT